MFDIKEYFDNEYKIRDASHDIVNIDEDITRDINNLLSSRFDSLYQRDRFKHGGTGIEIIYPSLQYPGNNSLILNPDRIRYLLSFYPNKSDFCNIDKIVIRPRFIEIGNIELVSLYLRRKKILVLYLYHPHFYRVKYATPDGEDESGNRMEIIMRDKLMDGTIQRDDDTDVFVHPLWYLLSTICHAGDDNIDKFFIKRNEPSDTMYEILNDVSFYYSRHGY